MPKLGRLTVPPAMSSSAIPLARSTGIAKPRPMLPPPLLESAGGVDADETRLAVDERAAAVARIDRRVRLNRALLASMVTTDGSARSATVAAGQAAAAPFEIGAVSAVELPFPGLQVSQTISPPATQPTIAASRNPSSSRTVVGRAEPTAPRLFSPQSRSDPPPSAPLRSGHPVAAALETSRAALPRAAPCPVLRVIRA
jgi:hypothetical protein